MSQVHTPKHYGHHKHATQGSPSAAFIARASGPATLSEKSTGVPASVTIAQAILESGWGRHHIGSANNYFGIKGAAASGSAEATTTEYVAGQKTTTSAHFRKYPGMTGSFVDHGKFLRNNPRYAGAFTAYAPSGNADAFAVAIAKAGYATDPHYARLIIGLMKKHDLYRYNLVKPAR